LVFIKGLKKMNLYFAPLEGITNRVYRKVHNEFFGGCDGYYAPFISPSDNEKIGRKGVSDILPENNEGIKLFVQVLTNNSVSFLKFSDKIKALGYDEINLNFGCPSGTVTGKGRGSGFLRTPVALDSFLTEIFAEKSINISVKTRNGFYLHDEMENLLTIYNKYPLTRLIIHPRIREEFYKGEPNMEAFKKAYENSVNKLCYNGNIFKKKDYENIAREFPNLESVMIGRGAIANPAIFREIKGGATLSSNELIEFTHVLEQRYNGYLRSDVYTLNKLKEIWLHIMWNFPEEKKLLKNMRKTQKLSEFLSYVDQIKKIQIGE